MNQPEDHPRYSISVAAELVGMHPQTLRMYEARAWWRREGHPAGRAATRIPTCSDCADRSADVRARAQPDRRVARARLGGDRRAAAPAAARAAGPARPRGAPRVRRGGGRAPQLPPRPRAVQPPQTPITMDLTKLRVKTKEAALGLPEADCQGAGGIRLRTGRRHCPRKSRADAGTPAGGADRPGGRRSAAHAREGGREPGRRARAARGAAGRSAPHSGGERAASRPAARCDRRSRAPSPRPRA